MSYRIEITADTLVELAGKALSLAAQLNTTAAVAAISPIMPEIAAPAKAKAAPKTKAPEPVAEEAPAPEPVAEEAPAPIAEEAPAAPTEIDFHGEVTPRVVKVVAKCGKPAMAAILEQFGVAKASHLDAERLPELIAAMDDAIAGAA